MLSYINKIKSRYVIGLPTTCDYQHCAGKEVLMLESCLLSFIFHCQYYTTSLIFLLDILLFLMFAYFGSICNKDNQI